MQEAHLRAEVNSDAQTMGNVASLAAEYIEPFSCCVCSPWVLCWALEFAFIPLWVSVEKEGGMIFEFIAMWLIMKSKFSRRMKTLAMCISVLGQGTNMLLGIVKTTTASSIFQSTRWSKSLTF